MHSAVAGEDYEPLVDFPVTIPAGGFGTFLSLDIIINDNFTEATSENVGIVVNIDLPRIEQGFGDFFTIVDDDRKFLATARSPDFS